MQKKLTIFLQHRTSVSLNRRYDTGEKKCTVIKRGKFTPKGVVWTQTGKF
jgi:hypothetical protein